MPVLVTCYSGAFYAERPRTVEFNGRLLQIEKVISRWRTPDGLFFHLSSAGGEDIYLVYNEAKDEWEIVPFQTQKSHPG